MVFMESGGKTLLWGGLSEINNWLNDTWEYDGADWVQVADTGPSPEFAGIAYDSEREITVLFSRRLQVAETWEWDGEAWTQIGDTGPLPLSGYYRMAYDRARKVTILEGGGQQPGPLSSSAVGTWAWDGTAWTQLADVGPVIRYDAGLAYDEPRQQVVFFGGWTVGVEQDDTWAWDGIDWKQVADIGPSPRGGHAMVGTGKAVLLFGGLASAPTYFADTWEWDGKRWGQRQDMGPSGRCLAGMSWDAVRARAVLFGGASGSPDKTHRDTWESFEG